MAAHQYFLLYGRARRPILLLTHILMVLSILSAFAPTIHLTLEACNSGEEPNSMLLGAEWSIAVVMLVNNSLTIMYAWRSYRRFDSGRAKIMKSTDTIATTNKATPRHGNQAANGVAGHCLAKSSTSTLTATSTETTSQRPPHKQVPMEMQPPRYPTSFSVPDKDALRRSSTSSTESFHTARTSLNES